MTNHKIDKSLNEYLSDLVYSFEDLSTRFTPLAIDPKFFTSEHEHIFADKLRRGMGIIEAERTLRRFVLIGEPGSGKTTALQYISQSYGRYILENGSNKTDISGAFQSVRIPVFMELNLYSPANSENGIFKMIVNQFYPYYFSDDLSKVIESWLRERKLLIILDGLNECPRKYREHAVRNIKNFINKYAQTHFLLSCRTRDYPEIFRLSSLSIQPLSKNQVDKFIYRSLHKVSGKETKIEKFKALLKDLYPDLGYTPLFLKIVLDVYKESQWKIPRNRGLLMYRFFEIWLKREFIKQQKEASTSRILFMFQLAGAIAFIMHNLGEVRTSREAVWRAISDFINNYIERHKISGNLYSADMLLDELLGMGLLHEKENRIKFYHQLFQEFFTGYYLTTLPVNDAIERLGKIWWEEPLKLYAGVAENATPLIQASLKYDNALNTAEILKVSQYCDSSLLPKIYRKLIYLLFDKFTYNREKAFEILVNLPDENIDSIIRDLGLQAESREYILRYRNLLAARRKLSPKFAYAELKSRKTVRDNDAHDIISESITGYTGSVARLMQRISIAMYESGMEAAVVLIREAEKILGAKTYIRELKRMIKQEIEVNKLLFVVWALSILMERRPADYIIDELPDDFIDRIISETGEWNGIENRELRILYNIAFNPLINRIWHTEYTRTEILYLDVPDKEKLFAQRLRTAVYQNEFSHEHTEFLLQIFWDLDSDRAEFELLKWLKDQIAEPVGTIMIDFLHDLSVSSKHIKECIALMKKAPPDIQHYFPDLIAKAGSKQELNFLINIIAGERYPLPVRSASVSSLRYLAGESEKTFLEELKNSDIPEIYNPAHDTLLEIERRVQWEEKMFLAEKAKDISVEILFDDERVPDESSQPHITVFSDQKNAVIINGTQIKLGSVSGSIFFYLAKNSTLGKYHTVDDIRSNLEMYDFVLDATAVRNRISDIRKRIHKTLEGRIDTHALLENAPRIGYRVNADVEVK